MGLNNRELDGVAADQFRAALPKGAIVLIQSSVGNFEPGVPTYIYGHKIFLFWYLVGVINFLGMIVGLDIRCGHYLVSRVGASLQLDSKERTAQPHIIRRLGGRAVIETFLKMATKR